MKPIAMKCSEEQFNKIKPILRKYNLNISLISSFDSLNYLTNNYGDILGKITNIYVSDKNNYSRTVFEEWDENTFLEYCDIKITKELPKSFCIKHDSNNPLWDKYIKWLNQKYYKDYNGDMNNYYGIKYDGQADFFTALKYFGPNCVELTLEQWDLIVNKQTNNTMQKLKVPITSVLEIHKIACSNWKTTISGYLSRVDSEQNITFTQKEVDDMFNAATKEQLPKLEEIFGKKVNPIDYDRIKTGSKVMLKHTGEHCNGLSNCDTTKPFDVVFYKTQHFINNGNEFNRTGNHSHYCTFHQNGDFVLFAANKNVDYIIEVIEY